MDWRGTIIVAVLALVIVGVAVSSFYNPREGIETPSPNIIGYGGLSATGNTTVLSTPHSSACSIMPPAPGTDNTTLLRLEECLSEKKELEKELTRLESEYESLKENYTRLLSEYKTLEEKYGDATSTISTLRSELNTTQQEYEALLANYTSLKKRYSLLSKDYEKLRQMHEAVVESLKGNYSILLSEYERLRNEYSALYANYSELQENYTVLREQHTLLQEEYNKLRAKLESLEENYTMLQEKYSRLKRDFEALQSNYTSLRVEYMRLKEDYARLEEDYKKLMEDYMALMERYMDLYASCNTSSTSFYIVMLGVPTCPHCQAMEVFLKNLPVDSYYCNANTQTVCNNAFWKLYDMGATIGTPTLLVCTKAGLILVEVGEYTDADWWLTQPTLLPPVRNGVVPVYMTGKKWTQITVTDQLYKLLCIDTLDASTPINQVG